MDPAELLKDLRQLQQLLGNSLLHKIHLQISVIHAFEFLCSRPVRSYCQHYILSRMYFICPINNTSISLNEQNLINFRSIITKIFLWWFFICFSDCFDSWRTDCCWFAIIKSASEMVKTFYTKIWNHLRIYYPSIIYLE